MSVSVKIQGMDKVMKNLNDQVSAMKDKTIQGLLASAAYIRRDMGKVSPLVPVDTRNLDHSFFITAAVPTPPDAGEARFIGKEAPRMTADHAQAKMNGKAVAAASRNPLVVMGFSANYAAEVHETENDYKRPGSGPKFFEQAINRNTKKVLEIIGNYAKV
jgi:hypothetical protein